MARPYLETVEYLLARDKEYSFADTCLLLDIIRTYRAQNFRLVERAISMREELKDDSANYVVVISFTCQMNGTIILILLFANLNEH